MGQSKSKLDELIEKIKIMEPGQVMCFIADQLKQTPVKFLATHAGSLAVNAVKNGWIKGSSIKDALKDFKGKNAEDTSGIDYKNLELDDSTVKLKCLFDGESIKKLEQFKQEFSKQLKDIEDDQKEANDKLVSDAKKAGLKISDKAVKEDGLVIASVIDKKDNKGKKSAELNAELKAKLELQKQLEELKKKQEEIMKKLASAGSDVDIDDAIEANKAAVEASKKSDKKDDKKTKNEAEKLVEASSTLSFSCGGHSSLVDDQAIRNAAYAIGKTVKNKEEAIAKFTEWLKDAAANRGPKGAFSALDSKDIERTLTNGNTVLKGLQDYAAKVFENPDAIRDQVSQKILDSAVDGSVDPSEFGVKFVAPSDASFEKLIRAMNNLDSKDPEKIKAAGETIKKFREFASNFSKSDPFYLNACKGAEAMYAAKTGNVLDGSTAPKDLIEKAKNFKGSLHKFADNMEKGFDKAGIEQTVSNSTEAHSSNVQTGAADAADFEGKGDAASEETAEKTFKRMENAVKNGLVPLDSKGRVFNYMNMSKRIKHLDDIFDDGKISPDELKQLETFKASLNDYQDWAVDHADSTDPKIQQQVALIKRAAAKFNNMIADNKDFLHDVDSSRLGGDPNSAKAMVGNEEMKEELQKKSGITMFTALGWARLAAKTTGYILNHGKTIVDVLGAQAIKKEEDKYIVASMSALLSNSKDNKSKMSDTKFSVRYSLKDFKWHATCIDNRKMDFPEKEIIDLMLDSEIGKKFKEACISKWSKIFDSDAKNSGVVKFVLDNFEKIGLKANGNTKKILDTVKTMSENFDKIKSNFK